MSIIDIGVLRDELPELFSETREPPWGDDWVVLPADGIESTSLDDLWDFDDNVYYWETWHGVDGTEHNYHDWVIPGSGDGSPGSWRKPSDFAAVHSGQTCRTLPPDCLAFYLPFHYYFPTWWGVYIVAEGLRDLASLLKYRSGRAIDNRTAYDAAKHFLYRHESFHHSVECFATKLESIHRKPLYQTVFDSIYRSTFGRDDCLEEALANGYALRKVQSATKSHPLSNKINSALSEYVASSPLGYRRGVEFKENEAYADARDGFAEQNHNASFPHLKTVNKRIWRATPFMFSGISRINSRVNYLINKHSKLGIRLGVGARFIGYRAFARRLTGLGCRFLRQGKKHEIWVGPSGKQSQVPRHARDLKSATAMGITKQLGLNLSWAELNKT